MKGTSYDTRFLVELFYTTDAYTKNKISADLMSSKPNILSTAALSEIYRLTLEKEGKEVAEIRADSISKDFRLVEVDKDVAVQAAIIKHRNGMPFADSLIAATAKVLGVPCYTDDPHFKDVSGLTVKWLR